MKVSSFLLAALFFLVHSLISAQETMEPVPAIQFSAPNQGLIVHQLQIYPVLIVHETASSEVPQMYISIFFRDCAQRYSKIEIVKLTVDSALGSEKLEFNIVQAQNAGALLKPDLLRGGMTEDMLTEEGKKMLQTRDTYFLAEPPNDQPGQIAKLKKDSVVLYLEFKLYKDNGSPELMKQTLKLVGEKVHLTVVKYGDNQAPINQSVIIPEIPPDCLNN